MDAKSALLRAGIVVALTFFTVLPSAFAADHELSVEEAVSVYRSAVRQSEATAEALKSRKVDRSSSDEAYSAAFTSALWEGLKLIKPNSTLDERANMASLIGSGKMLADAASGSALADYIVAGFDIDAVVKVSVEKDAEEAFRLGYTQALKRQRYLPKNK